jgi:hypothetical protein
VTLNETKGPQIKIDFKSVHLKNFVSAFIFILNPSRCDAFFKVKHLSSKKNEKTNKTESSEIKKEVNKNRLVLPKIKTIYNVIDDKNAQFVDDPSVFFFQFENGLIKANSTLIEHLPETTLFTTESRKHWESFKERFRNDQYQKHVNSSEYLFPNTIVQSEVNSHGDQNQSNVNYSNTDSKALKLGLVFKPKRNVFYRSKFKLDVYNGLGIEFVLQGKGDSLSETIQINY